MNTLIYPAHLQKRKTSPLNFDEYQKQYAHSIEAPDDFWAEQANKYLTWFKPWQTVLQGNFVEGNIKWFEGAQLNACYNALDRHLPEYADQIALIWQGDEMENTSSWTYQALHEKVCRLANVLKKQGIKKGDHVCIYLPMIPEAMIAILACARIGAIHSVVFAGFSAHALHDRILDANCTVVITADESMRSGKAIPLKIHVDSAIEHNPSVTTVLVVQRTFADLNYVTGRDQFYHEAIKTVSADCPCEVMQAEDPLFILYTSGSTGKPKGILHTTAGYLLYAAMTFQMVFDYVPGQVHWCTADVGWITGHSYVVYGPLINRATTLMFEGVPTYPDPGRFWQVIDQHQVNIFYTAPTALRALIKEGDEWVKTYQRDSLRVLGSVGEPINPQVWLWYYQVVGENRCPIVDTWWQTETGGFMITPLAHVTDLKPGSATLPFFGIKPKIIGPENYLVISQPWPGMARSIHGDHARFLETYFKPFPGYYLTGDGAHRDEDGYYWLTGRIDDVINVSGHRLGTAEIESALVSHPDIAEAAVVGFQHEIKGEGIYAYVIAKTHVTTDEALKQTLTKWVAEQISPIAKPDHIAFVEGLPKTRSGKIMRRILRKLADGLFDELGDTSTLADPAVVENIKTQVLSQQ